MKFEKKWHLYAFIVSLVLIVFSIVYAIMGWNDLPARIPTHFGISGQPDAWGDKSFLLLFFPVIIQIILTPLFLFLYFRPKYMNMPTSLLLTTLPEKQRDRAFSLLRNVSAVTLLWINLLFTYLTYMIISGAKEESLSYQGWLLLGLVGVMLIWLLVYNIYIYKVIKKEFSLNSKN